MPFVRWSAPGSQNNGLVRVLGHHALQKFFFFFFLGGGWVIPQTTINLLFVGSGYYKPWYRIYL